MRRPASDCRRAAGAHGGAPSNSDSGDRFVWLGHGVWICVLATVVAVWWRTYGGFQVGTYMDDAKYIILARSLVAGGPYGLTIGPGPLPTTGYPFLFPLLLSPFVALWPTDFDRMTVVSLAATLTSITVLYWGWPLLTRTRSRGWGLGVSALYGLSPLTLGHAGIVMPEPVCTTLVWSALVLVEYVARRRAVAIGPMLALGFLCTAAAFTRSVGFVLWLPVGLRIATTVGVSMRRVAAFAAGALLVLLPTVLLSPVTLANLFPAKYVATVQRPRDGTYDPSERNLITRVARGLKTYGGQFAREAIMPLGGGDSERAIWNRLGLGDLVPVTSFVLASLIAMGVTLGPRASRVCSTVLWFELLYLAILLLWPFRTLRYLYPILPFLMFQFLVGLRLVVGWLLARLVPDRAAPMTRGAVALVVVALATVPSCRFARAAPSTAFAPDYRAAATWLRLHTPPDAVILANEWESIALYAQRPIVPAALIGSVAALTEAIQRRQVSYVLIVAESVWRADGQRQYGLFTRETLLPLVETLQHEGLLQPVYESDPRELMKVYRVEPGRSDAAVDVRGRS